MIKRFGIKRERIEVTVLNGICVCVLCVLHAAG